MRWRACLRPGGRLILLLPNTAHWRVRWWLLRGRFPVRRQHAHRLAAPPLLHPARHRGCCWPQRGITIEQVDGSASLWVTGLYPAWLRRGLPARLYTRLARRWPVLFARDFIVVGRKQAGGTTGAGR